MLHIHTYNFYLLTFSDVNTVSRNPNNQIDIPISLIVCRMQSFIRSLNKTDFSLEMSCLHSHLFRCSNANGIGTLGYNAGTLQTMALIRSSKKSDCEEKIVGQSR